MNTNHLQSQEVMLIKYESDDANGFDLGLLGESFSGMSAVLKELCDLTGIQGEFDIKTTRIEHGSVNVFNAVHLMLSGAPFASPKELYDFLRVASPEHLLHAQAFFSDLKHAHRTVNDYIAQNPLDFAIISGFVMRCFKEARKLKKGLSADTDLAPRQARRLQSMVMAGKYKRAFKPITQGNVTSIKVASISTTPREVVISEENVGDYLPDEDQILAELLNGKTYEFAGEVVALQSTKGETLKVRIDGVEPSFSLLTAYPDEHKSTEDFKEFYKKEVAFTAEVLRRSMYKRPELKIIEMSLRQAKLL